ncbi:MarR family winged helix-turn-helix transcriptional regulator [Pararhizobium haloflavum]|uniref:MarR family winged helix-turn-helix transcriptional regulator n=1 Tax=Pararhizobium haloflavum TaxID=2037914 RepID=UPI001FDEDBFA|nr:MarR family transcriptional regulator [Pararhizobium haloflavum]
MSDIEPMDLARPDIARQRLRVWLKLLKTQRGIEAELRERLRLEFGTTLPRFDVLAALYRAEKGMKMSELSAELMVSNGNVTGIVERLVTDGLVVRVSVKGDRRAMLVRLTNKGRADFAAMATVHRGWVSELLQDVDDGTADELLSLLGLIDRKRERE